MKINDFRVGQEVYEYDIGKKDDAGKRISVLTIRKIYKNHLYASYNGRSCGLSREWKKFILKNSKDEHLTSDDGRTVLVPDEDSAADYIEIEMLRRWLKKMTSDRNIKRHSLESLREVKKILEAP